jgi:4-hydroxybenzoate polyprenyltransferase
MVRSFSKRLLAVLQFTRSALVFTAISNAWAALLLRSHLASGAEHQTLTKLDLMSALWMLMISAGLYGFGMSLNDVIDRRRDATIAADRPLPSGRLPVAIAKAICAVLLSCALAGGILLSQRQHDPRLGQMTLLLVLGVTGLICFYDFAGKYLLSLGLLTLGLIRFFHASIADPTLSQPWHPLLLLNHVTIVSSIAYAWEQKRPLLTRRHVVVVGLGLLSIDALLIGLLAYRRGPRAGDWMENLSISSGLILPVLAVVLFAIVAVFIRGARGRRDSRGGRFFMLVGLLWLIVYDAAFVAGQVSLAAAGVLLVLLPVSWASVKLIRGWSAVVALSDKPQYLRAG